VVDAVAHNAAGQKTRRRLEVFSGDVFITQFGSEFRGGKTELTFRNLAPDEKKHQIELTITEADGKRAKVFSSQQTGHPGPMIFSWDGRLEGGKSATSTRFLAELVLRDEKGRAVQREELLFNHDTPEAERARYGQVHGRLKLKDEGGAANARVELVDEQGRVVQRTVSTADGNYRFKNVHQGTYRVRVKKDGFEFDDAKVEAAPAKEAPASLMAR
jgi:squalene-hopene/tetraprenyl-beta-curcumene cyclase